MGNDTKCELNSFHLVRCGTVYPYQLFTTTKKNMEKNRKPDLNRAAINCKTKINSTLIRLISQWHCVYKHFLRRFSVCNLAFCIWRSKFLWFTYSVWIECYDNRHCRHQKSQPPNKKRNLAKWVKDFWEMYENGGKSVSDLEEKFVTECICIHISYIITSGMKFYD